MLLRRRILLTVSFASVSFLLCNFTPPIQYHPIVRFVRSFSLISSKSNSLAGWHSRALQTPYAAANRFQPKLDSLTFAVLNNALGDAEGFTMALFEETDGAVAVDASGRVLRVSETDAAGLALLANGVNTLPKAGGYRNTWRINWRTTCRPISILLIKDGNNLQQTGVYGYGKGKKVLESPVGNVRLLPDVLYEFLGLALEAREGYEIGRAGAVVEQVRNVLKDASVV